MDDKTINAVVDNLATKLGVAVEQLQPIAETLVWETRCRGIVSTSICLGFAAICTFLLLKALCADALIIKEEGKKDDCGLQLICVATLAMSVLISIGFGIDYSMQIVAPTLSLIETLK